MPRSFVAKLLFSVPSHFYRAPLLGFLPLIWSLARSSNDISTILVRKGAQNAFVPINFRSRSAVYAEALSICIREREFDATARDAYAIIARRSPTGLI